MTIDTSHSKNQHSVNWCTLGYCVEKCFCYFVHLYIHHLTTEISRIEEEGNPRVTLSFSQSEAVVLLAVCRLSSGQPESWSSGKDDKLLLSRVTAAHMAPYVTVHAFLNNTRELHMSLNASSRRNNAAELEKLLHAFVEKNCNSEWHMFTCFCQ